MRRVIVVTSLLVLLWIGWGMAGRLLPDLVPGPSFLMKDTNDLDKIDLTGVQDPFEAPDIKRALQSGFSRAPLSARPFAIRLGGVTGNEPDLSELQRRLAEHILRIAPRHVAATLKLAELDYLDGKYEETAAGISKLMELDRPNANTFLDVLTAMTLQNTSRPAIEELLEEQPAWGARLVSKLARESRDTDFLISLARDYPASQDAVVRSLVADGELDRAHAAFLEFLDDEARTTSSVPFDSRFEQISGAQPFNWRINRSFANIEQRGGLAVSFFGQGRPWIAEQTIKLSPGTYTISFVMEGNLYKGGGSLEWSLQCLDAREPLMTLSVEELTSLPEAQVATFAVPPENCGYQRLRLSGVAGEFPRTARALVDEVTVTPAAEVAAP